MNAWKPYLDTVSPDKQKIIVDILEEAAKYIPEPEPVLSYAMPTLKYKGKGVIAVAVFKNHIGIYPFGKKTVTLVQNKLKHADCEVSAIRYAFDTLPTKSDIQLIVETKLQEIV